MVSAPLSSLLYILYLLVAVSYLFVYLKLCSLSLILVGADVNRGSVGIFEIILSPEFLCMKEDCKNV